MERTRRKEDGVREGEREEGKTRTGDDTGMKMRKIGREKEEGVEKYERLRKDHAHTEEEKKNQKNRS